MDSFFVLYNKDYRVMKGKTIIQKAIGNKFWDEDILMKNARGKKHSWAKAEAKSANRKVRRSKIEIND